MKNPIAKSLRSAHLQNRIIKSKKAYDRKTKHKPEFKAIDYRKSTDGKPGAFFMSCNLLICD